MRTEISLLHLGHFHQDHQVSLQPEEEVGAIAARPPFGRRTPDGSERGAASLWRPGSPVWLRPGGGQAVGAVGPGLGDGAPANFGRRRGNSSGAKLGDGDRARGRTSPGSR
jgi:hypothetical protein